MATPEIYPAIPASEVARFINQHQPTQPVAAPRGAPASVEFDMTPEQLAAAKAVLPQAVEAPMLPEPELPLCPTLDPRQEELSRGWSMRDPSAPDVIVHVTEQERDEYFRAMLTDRPSVWNIEMLGGSVVVRISTPSTWLQEIVEQIMESRSRELHPQASKARWHAEYIRAVLYIRVQEVFHEGVSILKVPVVQMSPELDLKQNAVHLDALLQFHNQVNPERFKLLIAAAHIQDIKWNICSRKLASGNFWQPAGTV